jgi:hypothetical protein
MSYFLALLLAFTTSVAMSPNAAAFSKNTVRASDASHRTAGGHHDADRDIDGDAGRSGYIIASS